MFGLKVVTNNGPEIVISGTVAEYADLPDELEVSEAGKAYFVEADGLLYVWDGSGYPTDTNGIEFRGPTGLAGDDGADGADGQPMLQATGVVFDFLNDTLKTLYTVPVGKRFVLMFLVFRDGSAELADLEEAATFGWEGGVNLGPIELAQFTDLAVSADRVAVVHFSQSAATATASDPPFLIGAAGEDLQMQFEGDPVDGATVTVDVIGYLLDA